METMDVRQAALNIRWDPNEGAALLNHPYVQKILHTLRARQADRTELYADDILRRFWMLAIADARELQEIWICACRWCHGIEHQYQSTDDELRQDLAKHRLLEKHLVPEERTLFDERGGGGYDKYAKPHPECPECRGHGIPQLKVHDSRDYSPQAAALFNGVEVDPKSGKMRILMRDRSWALDRVAQHVIGQPIARHAIAVLDPMKMSNEQIEAAIESINRLLPQPAVVATEEKENG